jgi:hypothetical protein
VVSRGIKCDLHAELVEAPLHAGNFKYPSVLYLKVVQGAGGLDLLKLSKFLSPTRGRCKTSHSASMAISA